MKTLDLEDMKHRLYSTYVLCQGKTALFEDIVIGNSESENKVVVSAYGQGSDLVSPESIKVVAPENQYVNFEKHALFIWRTGARHFKKGFSLFAHNGYHMYWLSSPTEVKINQLNSFSPEKIYVPLELYKNAIPTAISVAKSKEIHYLIAKNLLEGNKTFGTVDECKAVIKKLNCYSSAFSKNFCLALSSNTDYEFDLFSGLFHIGFMSGPTFYVNPSSKQELSDFLNRSGQTQYGIVSLN